MADMKDIISLSCEYGANADFVLAGGGNTSVKDEDYLWVKRSGTGLAGITEDGFVKLCRKGLAATLKKRYSGTEDEVEAEVLAGMMSARCRGEDAKRPSVEALLHALFPQKLVVHLHPAAINGMTCAKDAKAAVVKVLGEDLIWMNETKPGYTLAASAARALKAYKKEKGADCNLMVLQNHGIFFAADTAEEMRTLISGVMAKVDAAASVKPDMTEAEFDADVVANLACEIRMLAAPGASSFVTFTAPKSLLCMMEDKAAFAPVDGAYTPDHIVYTGHMPAYAESAEDEAVAKAIAGFKKKYGAAPRIVCVKGVGCFAVGSSKKNADIAAAVFRDAVKIAVYTKNFGGNRFMAPKMVSFIRNWEVEKYRSSVSLAGAGAKRLSGRIAIVTGGAQGFGYGVAEEMCAEGASVVIADMNAEGAAKAAETLCADFGAGAAFAVACNVADEASVENLVRETVCHYGGLDVFVSNAGILRSGGLEDMDLKTFDLMTKVNYEAYFLCVKYAARVMRREHSFDADRYFDIIQINSKSGLSGSNRNFAYAGGKFGGIGLTQSFALELVDHRIKVNSICPGNFFDGPLWSDPEKGLFIQYLRSGKVPGAKTVEDVKIAYENKVPMRRGCGTKDVARALFYIIEQEYETGQAVPVTGGQNMLN